MPSPAKALREGSAVKRAAILTAARELFLTDGFDRTSVDAVSARAGVSKRTVYDYFGDKQTLLQAVVADISESLIATVRRTIAGSLTGITDPAQLEDALVGFSLRIATDMLGSADYTTLIKLLGGANHLSDPPFGDAPEDALGEQLAAFTQAGLLATPDPRLAADHLIVLTFGVVQNRLGGMPVPGDDRVRPLVVEGVRAFLRAYSA